jgi:hypothetical protein
MRDRSSLRFPVWTLIRTLNEAYCLSQKCQKQTLGNGLASRYGACPDRSNLWAQGSRAEAASIREYEDQSDAPHADEGRLHHVRWREVLDGGRGTPGALQGDPRSAARSCRHRVRLNVADDKVFEAYRELIEQVASDAYDAGANVDDAGCVFVTSEALDRVSRSA